jgi:hypothetical protein
VDMDNPIFMRPPLEDGVLIVLSVTQKIRRSMCTPVEIQAIRPAVPAPVNMKRQTPESDNGKKGW